MNVIDNIDKKDMWLAFTPQLFNFKKYILYQTLQSNRVGSSVPYFPATEGGGPPPPCAKIGPSKTQIWPANAFFGTLQKASGPARYGENFFQHFLPNRRSETVIG